MGLYYLGMGCSLAALVCWNLSRGTRAASKKRERAYASRSMDDCIVVMERCLLRWPSPNGNLAANACKKTVYHRFLCELRGRERRPGAVNEKRMIA